MTALFDALLLGGPRSGVEVAVAETAKALHELAADKVTFAVRSALTSEDDWPREADTLVAPSWARGRAGRILAEQFWLPRAARGHRILHGPAYVLPLAWRGAAVLTIYDLIALAYPQWAKSTNSLHYRFVVPRSVRRANVVIVPSAVVAEEVSELLGVPEAKIRVLSLGVRDVFRKPPERREVEDFEQRYGLGRPYFAVVGNIEPKKNVRGIVRAFEIAAVQVPHDLVIAGRIGWRCREDLEAIKNSPVRNRIHVVGRPSDADLRCLYRGCTALVQWSLYEGFGLVPLEGMACGAAVIISNGGALPEVAGPGAHKVRLGEPSELAEAMVWLAEDSVARRELVQAGLQWSQQFSWRIHAEKVLQIYHEVG